MEDIVLEFLRAPPSAQTAVLLDSTVEKVHQRVLYLIHQIDRLTLSLLSRTSYYTTSMALSNTARSMEEAEHWCVVGYETEQVLVAFFQGLQSLHHQRLAAEEEEGASVNTQTSPQEDLSVTRRPSQTTKDSPAVGPSASVILSSTSLYCSLTLVQRYKSALSGALLKASLAMEQEKNRRSRSLLAGRGEGRTGHSKPSRADGHTMLSNQEALKSLVRTRATLSVELQKVESAFQEIKKDAETMDALHESLQEVRDSMGKAKTFTKKLLNVQFLDSILLNGSFLFFFATILYIWFHRIFGFFPVTVH